MVVEINSTDSLKISHGTVSSEGISDLIQKHYKIGEIDKCYLEAFEQLDPH